MRDNCNHTTTTCTNNNIQTLLTVQYYELIISDSNNVWYLVVKKSWLLLVFFLSGLVGCVAPDLRFYGIGSNIGNCTRNANGCPPLSAASVNMELLTNCPVYPIELSSLVSTRA